MTNDDVPIIKFDDVCPNGHRRPQEFRADELAATIDTIKFHCIDCDQWWQPNDRAKRNIMRMIRRQQRPTPDATAVIPKTCGYCGAQIEIECDAGLGSPGQMAEYADHCPAPKCGKVIRLLLPGSIVDVRLVSLGNRAQETR